MSGRLPGCRRSGEVTRLRRLVDQHSGGGTGVNARRVSAAGLWHMGFCTCVGYVCRVIRSHQFSSPPWTPDPGAGRRRSRLAPLTTVTA